MGPCLGDGGGGGQFLGPRLSESVLDTNASLLGQG